MNWKHGVLFNPHIPLRERLADFVCCLVYLPFLLLAGCATTPTNNIADKASQFANSRTGVILQAAVITAALDAATQYAVTGKVDTQKIIASALDGSAESIRSLAGTPKAESPGAIASSATIGAGLRSFDNTVSPIVAGQVTKQMQEGIGSNQSIENVATSLNQAAARVRAKSKAK